MQSVPPNSASWFSEHKNSIQCSFCLLFPLTGCLYPLKGPTLNFFSQVGEDLRVPINLVPTILPWAYPINMTLLRRDNTMGWVNICQFQSTCWDSSAINNLYGIFNFIEPHPIWCSEQLSEIGKTKIYYLRWTKLKTEPVHISMYSLSQFCD